MYTVTYIHNDLIKCLLYVEEIEFFDKKEKILKLKYNGGTHFTLIPKDSLIVAHYEKEKK